VQQLSHGFGLHQGEVSPLQLRNSQRTSLDKETKEVVRTEVMNFLTVTDTINHRLDRVFS